MTKENISEFGKWFQSHPRVIRQRLIYELTKTGLTQATVRGWMYREAVPKLQYHKHIEKVTGHAIETLFPF